MKLIIKILFPIFSLPACDTTDASALSDAEASTRAGQIVGGHGGTAERGLEGTTEVWEVPVHMSNGAEIEVKFDIASGDLVVLEDKTGPFDYPDFTPTEGVLSYAEITTKALERVPGTVMAWEFKRESPAVEDEHDDEPSGDIEYEYEFYVTDADDQLWEIKFDAHTGAETETEAKEMIDP